MNKQNGFGGLSLETLETRETPSRFSIGLSFNGFKFNRTFDLSSRLSSPVSVTTSSPIVLGTSSTVTSSASAFSSSGSSGTGSSSSSVYAFSAVDANGVASAYTTGGTSGGGTAFGTATATGVNGTITSVFVG